jgi:hypothetical protein
MAKPYQGGKENGSQDWIEHGVYLELDKVASRGRSTSVIEATYVIFIGVQINDALPSRIGEYRIVKHLSERHIANNVWHALISLESTWKSWSKVGLLSRELIKSGIQVLDVTFFRQIAPRSLSLFTYCFFVNISFKNNQDQVKKRVQLDRLYGDCFVVLDVISF